MSQETEMIYPDISMEDNPKMILDTYLEYIERHTGKDVLMMYGPILHPDDITVRDALEALNDRKDTLLVILHTDGGIIELVEAIVQILRHHYKHVHFLVPHYAQSAGTVLALSGDKLYMDYFSRLGPADPQVSNPEGESIPALSYRLQFEKLIAKGELSQAETILLNKLNLAELHKTELAAGLCESLIRDWLVKYQFKDWETPLEQKWERAVQIAAALNDHQRWYTHGRGIYKDTLEELGLQIDDYSVDNELKFLVWHYFEVLKHCLRESGYRHLRHNRAHMEPDIS